MEARYAIFDFDGTISTLRCGWETIMAPLMLEEIAPNGADDALRQEVAAYIDESTGIQTAYQMQWLAERVRRATGKDEDAWYYKDLYNRRILAMVEEKKKALEDGSKTPGDFLIAGSVEFLHLLREAGFHLFLASGTDDVDVKKEAALLGVADLFEEIAGAPAGSFHCSKERVLRDLIARVDGEHIAVFGDGKVEIALARELGATAIGIASDERRLRGVDPKKYARLQKAGAERIVGDFTQPEALMRFVTKGA